MTDFLPQTLIWWVTAIDVPLITAFVVSFARFRREIESEIESFRERLSGFKLEVAQNYASINHVKDLEARLITHLFRIENKLDNSALKPQPLYLTPPPKQES